MDAETMNKMGSVLAQGLAKSVKQAFAKRLDPLQARLEKVERQLADLVVSNAELERRNAELESGAATRPAS